MTDDRPGEPTPTSPADPLAPPGDPLPIPPVEPPTARPAGRSTGRAERRRSLVIVNTGDGKGKSTAAFGVVMRSVARGWKVAVVQFIKSGEWKVGEETVAARLGVDWWTVGDGFTWDSDDLERSRQVARAGWEWARRQIESGAYQLVVLDEITYPVNWGWIDLDEVVATIQARPDDVHLVLTGRDAPGRIIDVADTVTEMKQVKHAFEQGIPARRGIDY